MNALALLCVVALATAPDDPPAPPSAGVPETAARRVESLVLQVEGEAEDEAAEALALRAPELQVFRVGRDDFSPRRDELFAYALAHPLGEATDQWRVTVIMSDGRAFFRTITVGADDRGRVLATDVLNLVWAAEAGSIAPDAQRPLPPGLIPDAEPEPEPAPEPEPDPAPEPEPAPPKWYLGVGVHGAFVAGFGPPTQADAIVGGAGGLDLALRMPRNVVALLEAQALSRTSHGHRLVRIRTTIGAGYDYTRGFFELVAAGYVSVAPWRVTSSGRTEAVAPLQLGDGFSRVLIGGGIRLSPGLRVPIGTRHAFRVALRTELAGSAMPRGGIGLVEARLADGSLTPVFRLGGLELVTGVLVGGWFGLPS